MDITKTTREFTQFMDNMTDDSLGKLLKNYLEDTQFNNWDGWDPKDIPGACALLEDIMANYRLLGSE